MNTISLFSRSGNVKLTVNEMLGAYAVLTFVCVRILEITPNYRRILECRLFINIWVSRVDLVINIQLAAFTNHLQLWIHLGINPRSAKAVNIKLIKNKGRPFWWHCWMRATRERGLTYAWDGGGSQYGDG